MSIKPPFTDLEIKKAEGGFYEGYSVPIALISKISMTLLVIWALVWPGNANSVLSALNSNVLNSFNTFYIIAVGGFAFFLFIIALIPASGRKRLGAEGVKPEFSNFSWFSMMFGAGLGVGLMVFATAEPLGLWGSNPVIIDGDVVPNTEEAVQSGYRYTFLHYGFHAWAIYVTTGLSLAYYAYTRDMPLTIRSALTPLFGKMINGTFGHIVDVLGVVATILGVSVTIGFGVSQFVDGVYAVTDMSWLMNGDAEAPKPSVVGLLAALFIIMGLSILSAVSGVGRGIKYLSNLNLVLSIILLLTFVFFGSFAFAMTTFGTSLVDYILHFAQMSFGAYGPLSAEEFAMALPDVAKGLPAEDIASIFSGATNAWGSLDGFKETLPASVTALENSDEVAVALYAAGTEGRQFGWQAGWTTFYWAWWIAFSPFVGLFLARISKGRTVREFILGCVIAPAIVCFLWMTILGGTAIDLELTGVADGAIIGATNTAKLFVTLGQMLSGGVLSGLTIMCVVLIMTFLVTSADSGILVMNTIMSGGEQETGIKHRIIWGVILTSVIGALIIAGNSGAEANPFGALQNAMIIGALPFTMVMVLMVISLAKALYRDNHREKIAETTQAAE
ncbi:BCCT family transporter [Kiloniella sp. EL199]|uniref:BCCT family transporter n=1 Tax=Kiloniella sp. EL199 TaxID=2107581 RepID=UPI000EA2DD4F|nr:BCCT family transporter [Kiloniella sp. EL199]